MQSKSFPRRQFHNNRRDHQYQNRNDSQHSTPHFFQRRSWHGNKYNKNEQEPTYQSDRYKHGWLFVEQDKYQKEYYEKLFESEKFNNADQRVLKLIISNLILNFLAFIQNCSNNFYVRFDSNGSILHEQILLQQSFYVRAIEN